MYPNDTLHLALSKQRHKELLAEAATHRFVRELRRGPRSTFPVHKMEEPA